MREKAKEPLDSWTSRRQKAWTNRALDLTLQREQAIERMKKGKPNSVEDWTKAEQAYKRHIRRPKV